MQFVDMSDRIDKCEEREKITGELPKGTKHLQLKGYALIGSKQLLFGSCIDGYGRVLSCRIGSQMISYQDVLIENERESEKGIENWG